MKSGDGVELAGDDGLSVLRWFVCYGAAVVFALVLMVWLGGGYDWKPATWWSGQWSISERWDGFLAAFKTAPIGVKLLGLGIYIYLCVARCCRCRRAG